MEPIGNFAEETGGSSSGNIRWEPQLEKNIIQYLELNSKMRQFCQMYRLNGTLTANLPKNSPTGMAVEIVEGTEIPAVRTVISTVDVKVSGNGTAVEWTDESKMLDWYGDLAGRELEEAAKRMLRKENTDILNTFVAGAGYSMNTENDDYIAFEDIMDAKTYLKKALQVPDTVFVGPDQYAELVKSDDFRQYYQSASTAPLREGTVGGTVAGLNVVEMMEMPDNTALVADMSKKPVWLVVFQDMQVEQFRINDERTDKVQMWLYEKPAVLKPEAYVKITVPHATP